MRRRPLRPEPMTRTRTGRSPQAGFGAIAAIAVLVVLAGLAAALVRLGVGQQVGASQSLQAARAGLAARAGVEWGLYQALKGSWASCAAGTRQTLDLSADTGMWVSVSCSRSSYNEGETSPGVPRVLTVWRIQATACNSSAGCPDASRAIGPNYVERQRETTATR